MTDASMRKCLLCGREAVRLDQPSTKDQCPSVARCYVEQLAKVNAPLAGGQRSG
jgi:hypothetical protein